MKAMMNTEVFFCDTYALIEIVGGNSKYAKYLDCILLTSEFNLMELYYAFLRDYNQQTADKYFEFWEKFLVQIPREIIKQAMILRLANRKEDLSYVDCIGYIFSQQNEIKFLTGDRRFENKSGVEFVK